MRSVKAPLVDALYSRAWLDLRVEPIVITTPRIESDRSYTSQLVEIQGHTFGYLGTRRKEGGMVYRFSILSRLLCSVEGSGLSTFVGRCRIPNSEDRR
jgi:hypothetical protein